MDSEEETILQFAGASFRSIWALEMLLTVRRQRDRDWRASDLIKELRSSRGVVAQALNDLLVAGLVSENDQKGYRYRETKETERLVDGLERLYAIKPTLVIQRIVGASNAKLQMLSNAFRIKE